MTEAKKDF